MMSHDIKNEKKNHKNLKIEKFEKKTAWRYGE